MRVSYIKHTTAPPLADDTLKCFRVIESRHSTTHDDDDDDDVRHVTHEVRPHARIRFLHARAEISRDLARRDGRTHDASHARASSRHRVIHARASRAHRARRPARRRDDATDTRGVLLRIAFARAHGRLTSTRRAATALFLSRTARHARRRLRRLRSRRNVDTRRTVRDEARCDGARDSMGVFSCRARARRDRARVRRGDTRAREGAWKVDS